MKGTKNSLAFTRVLLNLREYCLASRKKNVIFFTQYFTTYFLTIWFFRFVFFFLSLPHAKLFLHLSGAGVFFLSCSDGEQISFLFDCIVRGINPSRVPHGLRPTLPGEHTHTNTQTHTNTHLHKQNSITQAYKEYACKTQVRHSVSRIFSKETCCWTKTINHISMWLHDFHYKGLLPV